MDNIFGIDSHIPFKKALPIGLQHVLVMFVANITPIIILAGIMDFSPEFKASLVQNAMLIAGIGTSIQLFPLWKIGSRLPIVMGVSFTFLSVAIGVSTSLGYGTMMCAVIIGGIVEGLIGLFAKYWVRFITPVPGGVGAMTIVGSLNAGLNGDNKLLFTKSILDLISACMLASTLGIGVLFSALFVLVYQGGLVLLAGLLQNVLTDAALIAEISCAGSIMIIGLGLNILGITKLKVADQLPAIIFVPLIYALAQFLPAF